MAQNITLNEEIFETLNEKREIAGKTLVDRHSVETVINEVASFYKIEDADEATRLAFEGAARKLDYPSTITKTLKSGGTEEVPDPYVRDGWKDNVKLCEHPKFSEIKKTYFDNFENWSRLTLGDLTNEFIAHIKGVSAGSVANDRKKLSVWDTMNRAPGQRDSGAALAAAREAAAKAEAALLAQRAEMREKLIAQGLDPAVFGL